MSAPEPKASADSHELSFRWHRRIEEIADAWNLCFGQGDVLRSCKLHAAVEDSRLPMVELHYLVGENAGGPCCVVPCYAGRASLLTMASPLLQRLVGGIRKVFPGFLWINLFVIGSPVTTCGDLLGFRHPADSGQWSQAAITAIFDEIMRKAKSLKINLVVVKELAEELKDFLKPRIDHPFLFVESLPTTHLAVPPKEEGGYVNALCSKYRNKFKKRKAVATASGIAWESVPNCRGREAEVFELYHQVVQHSDFVFETVNKEFFIRVCESLGDAAFFIMGFQAGEGGRRLVSFELVMHDQKCLHPFYSGFDYSVKEQTDVYFNSFYAMIEEAERRGLQEIYLGQTAYEVKAELGASCRKLYIGVYHRRAWMRWVLWRLRGWLSPTVTFPKREVFRLPPTPKKNQKRAMTGAPCQN